MVEKTVLVLGGGVGGLVAANELRRRLGRGHRVVVLDRSAQHLFSPSLPWVMVGWRRSQGIVRDLNRMVRPGVEVVRAEVLSVSPAEQKVMTGRGELGYDYLVVALGAELAPEAVPGYGETAHNIYSLEGAARLHRSLQVFGGGQVAVVVSALPYKCPAAPYEVALLLHDFFRRRGLLGRVDLQVFTPEVLPMPVAGPRIGQAIKGMLEERGIGFHPNMHLKSVSPERRELEFQGGDRAGFDLLVAVPPHRPPPALSGSHLTNEAGWVPVDPRTLRTRYENIYAIGDVASITLPNGKALPKAGVFAHAEAIAVAHGIAAEVQGTDSETGFDGSGYCWIEMGGGIAGLASGDFYAKPEPVVKLRRPGRMWHWGRALFESYWMGRGLTRMGSGWVLVLAGRLLKVPASI